MTDRKTDKAHDRTVEESFPASDPPSNTGITGPTGDRKPEANRRDPRERREDERPKGRPTSDRHATQTAHQWEDEETPNKRG